MSGTRPLGGTLGSRPARHCLPLPPRQQWRRGRGHLPSGIRAQGLLSIPRGSPGNRHHSRIPYPPLTRSLNRRINLHRGLTKVFMLLRCRIPVPSSILDLRDRERHPNHLPRFFPCTLNTCKHSCRWKPAATCTSKRCNWKAESHPPLGIGPEILGRLARLTDTVGDNPHRRSPGSTPRRCCIRSLLSPPTSNRGCPERPMYPHPPLLIGLDRPHGDHRGVALSAGSPLHR